jgi:hypothetical protein
MATASPLHPLVPFLPHSILFSSNPHTTGIVEEACFDQIDEFNNIDLFRCRPPPPTTSVVPRALDTVEELLWLGSPTLAAYARQEIQFRHLVQEHAVAAAVARIRSIEARITAHRDTITVKGHRLRAVRANMVPPVRARLAVPMGATGGGGCYSSG